MRKTLYLSGKVPVSDIMEALDLVDLPEGCAFKPGERDFFDDIEVVGDDAVDAVEEADLLPEPERFSDRFDQTDVMDLSSAIRRGDQAEAELLLDRVFRDDAKVSEWVQLGRYRVKRPPVAVRAVRTA